MVGIVASRIAEKFHRPAILLSEGGDEAKGSGRSIAAFDLLGAVERTSEHLLTFGGHRAACGLRLRRDAIPAFREAFVAEAAAALGADDLRRVRDVDAIVGGDELTLGLADELELLAPHGFGNRQVTLLLHAAEVVAPGSRGTSGTPSTACVATAPPARPSTSISTVSTSSPRRDGTTWHWR